MSAVSLVWLKTFSNFIFLTICRPSKAYDFVRLLGDNRMFLVICLAGRAYIFCFLFSFFLFFLTLFLSSFFLSSFLPSIFHSFIFQYSFFLSSSLSPSILSFFLVHMYPKTYSRLLQHVQGVLCTVNRKWTSIHIKARIRWSTGRYPIEEGQFPLEIS